MERCPKCSYHRDVKPAIKTVEIDKDTQKKWLVSRCGNCEAPYDIEPYKVPTKKAASKLLEPPYTGENPWI